LPAFGASTLATITPTQVQAFLAAKREYLAPKTVNHALALLCETLEAAVTWGQLASNPARAVRPVATPRREMRVWTIAAGKNVKYVATQLGHHSAAFTLDRYGHLMDRLPVHPVEWIDDLVFPEGSRLHSICTCTPLWRVRRHAVWCNHHRG